MTFAVSRVNKLGDLNYKPASCRTPPDSPCPLILLQHIHSLHYTAKLSATFTPLKSQLPGSTFFVFTASALRLRLYFVSLTSDFGERVELKNV